MTIRKGDIEALIQAIANREGTAQQLASSFGYTVNELKQFTNVYKERIKQAASEPEEPSNVVTPTQLDELWITNKFERLKRLQNVADLAYRAIEAGGYGDSTLVREFRSYLMLAANELGQLLHRGSGDSADGETLNVSFEGIDLEQLK